MKQQLKRTQLCLQVRDSLYSGCHNSVNKHSETLQSQNNCKRNQINVVDSVLTIMLIILIRNLGLIKWKFLLPIQKMPVNLAVQMNMFFQLNSKRGVLTGMHQYLICIWYSIIISGQAKPKYTSCQYSGWPNIDIFGNAEYLKNIFLTFHNFYFPTPGRT